MSNWDHKWLKTARYFALEFSKDPGTKVGAVIARDKEFISFGYNGFPSRIEDKPEWLNDRAEKLKRTIHAEINAIHKARGNLDKTTLYLWPFPPCGECAKHIIQAGITRVVAPITWGGNWQSWKDSLAVTSTLFDNAAVELILKDIKDDEGFCHSCT